MKSTEKSVQVSESDAAPKLRAVLYSSCHDWVKLAQLRAEKCELEEAEAAYAHAFDQAKKDADFRGLMEALGGLLRIAGEARDEAKMASLAQELNEVMAKHPMEIPPLAWHCKGTVEYYQGRLFQAQRCWTRYLKAVHRYHEEGQEFTFGSYEECLLKGWISLIMMWRNTKPGRADRVTKILLARYENSGFKGVNGFLYLLMGWEAERHGRLDETLQWYHKAHASFLGEHNWYYHLYLMLWYARVCRIQQNYPQAYWYLDLLDKATSGKYFGHLRQVIVDERQNLEQDAVDLLVDSRKGVIKTRESSNISFGKQYVLLHILEALSAAHSRTGDDIERGLSKAEIIERVWKEPYRPEAHDNKLYYNINRLRKLIEPDVKNPQYLLNWKEGYRLAPGLRIQFVGARASAAVGLASVRRGN